MDRGYVWEREWLDKEEHMYAMAFVQDAGVDDRVPKEAPGPITGDPSWVTWRRAMQWEVLMLPSRPIVNVGKVL